MTKVLIAFRINTSLKGYFVWVPTFLKWTDQNTRARTHGERDEVGRQREKGLESYTPVSYLCLCWNYVIFLSFFIYGYYFFPKWTHLFYDNEVKFIFKIICEGEQVWNIQSSIFCVLDNHYIAGTPSSQPLTLIYPQQIS